MSEPPREPRGPQDQRPWGPPPPGPPGPSSYGPPPGPPSSYGPPGPSSYGPHPYGPAYGPPPVVYPAAPMNTLAILAIVFAVVFSPAGIVLGVLARKQIERTGEDGYGLATAGLWVGVALTALLVLYVGFMIVLFTSIVATVPTMD